MNYLHSLTFFLSIFLFFTSCRSSKNTSIEFSDGTYKGEIDNKGRKHGKGIYTWHDGSTYEGDFKNDARNGNGLFHWKNGESYKGDYLEDDRTGQGLYRWPDGSYYEGSFLRGKRHGLGTFHSVDGAVYVGQWFDDLQHGKGKLTNPNKTTIQAIWKNGKLIAQPSPLPKASTKPKLEKIDIPAPVEEDSPTPANIKVPKLVSPSQVEIIQQNSSKDLKKEPTKLFTKSEEDQIEKTPLQSLQEDDSKVDEVMPKSKLPDSASPTPGKHKGNDSNIWTGTVEQAEIHFSTELINGIDTVRDAKSKIPFSGKMQILNSDGTLIGEVNLLNGQLHGEEIFLNDQGIITERNLWENGKKVE
jgi:hypothetical protein